MTLMDKEFDLIVETSLEDINNWLLSVAFELSEDYIQVGYSQDSGWAIVDNPIIHPPGGDVHSHRFSASCTWHSKGILRFGIRGSK